MSKTDERLKDSDDGQPPSINVEGVDDPRHEDGVTLEEHFG